LLQLNRDWHIQIQESDSLENLLEAVVLDKIYTPMRVKIHQDCQA